MLTKLRRIVLEFGQEPVLQNALERLVTQVKNTIKTDCCSIYFADYKKQCFLLKATDGLAKDALGHISIGFSEGLIGLVGQREEPINIANAHLHPHFKYLPETKEDELSAFLGTPIIHQGKVLGILAIQQKQRRNFTEDEEAFLVTLAAQLAGAIASVEVRGVIDSSVVSHHQIKKLVGIAGASGVALAKAIVTEPAADLAEIALVKLSSSSLIASEKQRFYEAIVKTRADFEQLSSELASIINDHSLDIFELYKHLLHSASLGEEINSKIVQGWSAESALKLVIDYYAVQFESLDDNYIRERGSDIRDLGNRILINLLCQQQLPPKLPDEFILVAKEVTASMLAEYQHHGLKAIVSLSGSNNSHAAILARALGIPAIMGLGAIPLAQLTQQTVIVDGYRGELYIAPNQALQAEYNYLIAEEKLLTEQVRSVVELPCVTLDGYSLELQLNAGLANGFEHSKQCGAQGIGLYRTEIPFMERNSFPTEQEQAKLYQQVLTEFNGQPVTMRTLDIGGDKALPYFPIAEENPFLGWRGIRITLDHPEIFLLQIRAMMRANIEAKNLEIMLPMIATVNEVDDAISLINQAYYELCAEQKHKITKPKIGIMLEVPAVIFQLEHLAKRVDFFSVGSNDLTQYLLAVDRNNARVSRLYNSYHPAVLTVLNMIAQQAKKYQIPLSLCGELAGEPAGAMLLLAMGYEKLSMNPHNIARIKWVIRHIHFLQAKEILSQVLTFDSAEQVHTFLNDQLEQLGLGGFVRAGL
jgi:phosphotransferase system enzyme I (PtsP)